MTAHTSDLFILGAQKSGTSSLAAAIAASFDEVELSTPKEPMVFSKGDFECHRTFFVNAETPFFLVDSEMMRLHAGGFKRSGTIRLDASTSYLLSAGACANIARLYPDARAIVVIRDPVERMVSAYWHYIRTGLVAHGFDRAIELGPVHLVTCGFYKRQIQAAVEAFGRDRIFIASDRHVHLDPEGFATRFETFTGLRKSRPLAIGRENAGAYPKWVNLQLLANYVRQRSGKQFQHGAKAQGRLRTYGVLGVIAEGFTRLNLRKVQRPLLRTDVLPRLVELYERENSGIDAMLDFGNTSHWFKDAARYFERESLSATPMERRGNA